MKLEYKYLVSLFSTKMIKQQPSFISSEIYEMAPNILITGAAGYMYGVLLF